MSFSYKFQTLKNGNSHDSSAQLEMSAHEEEVTRGVEVNANKENEEKSVRFSPDLVDERIKASLDPLHDQISALAEMMDPLSKAARPVKLQRQVTAKRDFNLKRFSSEHREL